MSLKSIDLQSTFNGVLGDGYSKKSEYLKSKQREVDDDADCQKFCSEKEGDNSIIETIIKEEESVTYYVGNIPSEYRSADLRVFFSEFVEKKAFCCFHYRHRPETAKFKTNLDKESSAASDEYQEKESNTYCCIIRCKKKFSVGFTKQYHKVPWFDSNKTFTKALCNICYMTLRSNPSKTYLSKKEIALDKHNNDQQIYLEDFNDLIELNPPKNVMPQGNIGTPTEHFREMISKCKLPCSVIKKLGLQFSKSEKRYASVQMNYNTECRNSKKETAGKDEDFNETKTTGQTATEDDGEVEEWERYEAIHDDVDNQARPKAKERLFEEDIEVKWEKGGSGLVFYTDAYFWNELKGKDFDEDTVDDWDVDYSVYYEDGAGDKPSKDQLQMRIEKRRREGKRDGPTKYSEIRRKEKQNREKMTEGFAEFEKYSNAFGSRILKQQGWEKGDGVGSSKQGIKEPVDIQGQLPAKRRGLGFYGKKLDQTVSLQKKTRVAENDVYISTKYDEKDGEHIDAMRFHGMELLKYRAPKLNFQRQEESDNVKKI